MQPLTENMSDSAVGCILRFSQNHIGDLEQLHTAVHEKKPAAGYFAKKYDTLFTGAAYVGYLAYDRNMMPIAFYGVIPCFMSVDGEKTLSAQSADTMTHPHYRGMG